MNINNVFRDNFNSTSYYIKGNTVNDPYATKRKSNKNSDTIEISDDAYKVQQEENKCNFWKRCVRYNKKYQRK